MSGELSCCVLDGKGTAQTVDTSANDKTVAVKTTRFIDKTPSLSHASGIMLGGLDKAPEGLPWRDNVTRSRRFPTRQASSALGVGAEQKFIAPRLKIGAGDG